MIHCMTNLQQKSQRWSHWHQLQQNVRPLSHLVISQAFPKTQIYLCPISAGALLLVAECTGCGHRQSRLLHDGFVVLPATRGSSSGKSRHFAKPARCRFTTTVFDYFCRSFFAKTVASCALGNLNKWIYTYFISFFAFKRV